MAEVVTLLAGILLAATIFAGVLWSAAQAYRQTGRLRLAHGLSAALTLTIMAALSVGAFTLATLAALPLLATAIAAAWAETGASRLLPLILALFALALLLRLPFG